MLIDWFTVVAQVVNFLLLAWLLKRFLYRPILDAIDAREQRITTEISDANTKRTEAIQQRDEFQHKNSLFDEQHAARMNQVSEDAKAEQVRLFELARQESEHLSYTLQLAIKNEQQSLQETLNQFTQNEVFEIARKVLTDLADTSLEERVTNIFIKQLNALNKDEREAFSSAFKDSGGINKDTIIVRTAFALPAEQCKLIGEAINDVFVNIVDIKSTNSKTNKTDVGKDLNVKLKFVIEPDVVCGIELSGKGQKISWSIHDYLDSLSKGVSQLLESISNDKSNTTGDKQSKNKNKTNVIHNDEDETGVITTNASDEGDYEFRV